MFQYHVTSEAGSLALGGGLLQSPVAVPIVIAHPSVAVYQLHITVLLRA